MSAPLESTVVNKILKFLRERGAFAEKIHGDALQSALLDIIACYKGVFVMLEVKRASNIEPTQRQKYIISKVEESGGLACKVSSVDEVAQLLDFIDYGGQYAAFHG